MLKKIVRWAGLRAGRKDLENYVELLSVGTPSEVGLILAATGMARHVLKISKSARLPFPDAEFLGLAPVGRTRSTELSAYNLMLNPIRVQYAGSGEPALEVLANGVGVLMHSMRALAYPELLPLGRRMWAELLRGHTFFAEQVRALRPQVTDEEIVACWPCPNMLAPEASKL